MDREHETRGPGQRLRDYGWLGSYIGSSGLILVGMALFMVAHGDWLPGALYLLCGDTAVLRARRGHKG
jgi:hypothetical protein